MAKIRHLEIREMAVSHKEASDFDEI